MSQALARTPQREPMPRPQLVVEDAEHAESREHVPLLRGVSHEKAFAVAPALGLVLVASAEGSRAQAAAAIFAATMVAMLGVSAVNHRALLAPRWQPWLRRADHTAIQLFLAGTWTAVAMVTLVGSARLALLVVVWSAAIVASGVTIAWVDVPGWIPATISVSVGWAAAAALLDVTAIIDPVGVAVFVLGGVIYTAGAVVYALRKPDLHAAFGYHELFHLLVLGGVACHYATLALYVLPLAE